MPVSPIAITYLHAKNVWKKYLPNAKSEHLTEFVDEITYVSKDLTVLQTLVDISGAEWDGTERRWVMWGGMGGHRKTIIRGDRELGYYHSDAWLMKHPRWEVRSLAKRYQILYSLHGWNRATREWNLGMNWQKADGYIHSISKIQQTRRK